MSTSLPTLAFESSSLVDLLLRRARQQPEQRGYTFLVDGESEEAHLTYGELDRRARGIAAQLQSLDVAGARVLLLYPPGLDYLAAFFGCLYAGAVAVPAYPPRLNRPEPRLQAIVADAQATVALTTQAIFSNLERRFSQTPELKALHWLATDELLNASAAEWREPTLSRETLAFLQYTSGSTAAPKGVMVSHGNLLHNLSLIYRCYEHNEESRGVIWLPPYHDMGLIGGILQPLYGGFPVALLAPIAFLQNPSVWLQAISRYRATTSGGPNFAYDLCVRKITPEQRANLDLSSWSVAFTGAEPIQPETMEQFTQTFESCGFRREAFYPCYGLAEATLIVSGGSRAALPIMRTVQAKALENHRVVVVKDEGPTASDQPLADPRSGAKGTAASHRTLVGCGHALTDQKILIVNPETLAQCSVEEVGEIWAAGPSIAQGYWNRAEETERTFHARLADSGETHFLRTGDLGFIQEGELFVTGRLKDLIIIRGRNHYPQDIELTVERSHPALQAGSGAAFSVEAPATPGRGERLVVVQELARQARNADVEEVARAVRQAVAEQHELQVSAVVLLKPGHIPRTSSGKIQRHACRAGFLAEALEVVGRSLIDEAVAETDTSSQANSLTREALLGLEPDARMPLLENYLRTRVAQVIHISPSALNPEQPLIALGLDSLMSVELKSSLENEFGVSVPIESFLNGLSLAQLVTHLLDQIPTAIVSASAQAIPPVSRSEVLSLSFEQERLWLLDQIRPGNTAYNIPTVLRLTGDLDPAALEHSLNEIVRRHESLRLTFSTMNARPAPIIASTLMLSLLLEDVGPLPESEREAAALRLAAEEIQRSFNLAHGPLLRAKLIRLDAQTHLLVLVLHHIVGDLGSTVILVRELAALYNAYTGFDTANSAVSPRPARSVGLPKDVKGPLPELPIQYLDFAHWQRQNWNGEFFKEHLAYWQKQLANAPPLLELPTDHPRPEVQSFRGAYYTFALPSTLSKSLNELSQAEGVTVFMALLAAFYALLQRYSGQTDILVGAPIAGRDRPELRDLIGFFAYPLVLRTDLSGNPNFRALLARVRTVALEAYAHQAVPLAEVMRAARPPRSRAHAPLFQVMFGFLNQPLEAIELPHLKLSPLDLGKMTTDFDLFLTVLNGSNGLRGLLEYNADLFDSETIQQLVQAYGELLEEVIRNPEIRLSEINLSEALAPRARSQKDKLALAATFTSEPVKESLNFWLKEIDLPLEIEFAPYNQVFQQLLDPASLLAQNTSGINVILIRFEDWQRFDSRDGQATGEEKIERNVRDLALALKAAAARSATPYFVFVCQASPAALAEAERATFFQRMEALLASELDKASGVYLVTPAELAAAYPVANYYDPYGDEHGHIPYTPTFYTALGTMLARKIYALNHPPYKVIVLDCDHTLWKGVCGEDGSLGIELDPPRRVLQEFMVAQQAGGKLLCLCSKNDEADVVEVFEQRLEMPLRREHLVAWRINWQPKSENLRALAEELQLGLESFIFIDDNPVECAEVEAHCPEVLTLQLPAEVERIPKFLAHVWAFDQLKVTEADRERTSLYRQNAEREQFRREALTLSDFLAGLELKVEISELTLEHVERVAQLTQRTNQFNVTTIRRTETEIQQLYQSGGANDYAQALKPPSPARTTPPGTARRAEERGGLECLTVKVSDRFGDYGLVGVMIFAVQPDALRVDTFLLSCRVLGRGVEHQMLACLGELAHMHGAAFVEVPYDPTPKNKPALDFLNSAGAEFKEERGEEWLFRFSTRGLVSKARSQASGASSQN